MFTMLTISHGIETVYSIVGSWLVSTMDSELLAAIKASVVDSYKHTVYNIAFYFLMKD